MIDGPWFCGEQGTSVCIQAAHSCLHTNWCTMKDSATQTYRGAKGNMKQTFKKSQPGPVREWLNNISDHRLVCSFLIKLKDMEEDIMHDAKIPVFNCYLYQHHVPHTEQQTNCYWRSMRKDIKNKVKWYVQNKWFVCVWGPNKEVRCNILQSWDVMLEAQHQQTTQRLRTRTNGLLKTLKHTFKVTLRGRQQRKCLNNSGSHPIHVIMLKYLLLKSDFSKEFSVTTAIFIVEPIINAANADVIKYWTCKKKLLTTVIFKQNGLEKASTRVGVKYTIMFSI